MTRRPNIVYILADDLGYGDVSCCNLESKIHTPFMDSVAAGGMRFTDAHSNSAVCTPTRYGILTGRYCFRSPLKKGVLFGYDQPLIESDRLTVAQFLKQQGYTTACIGKWHLGLGWPRRSGTSVKDQAYGIEWNQPLWGGPHTVGFDYSLVLPGSLDMTPYCYVENGRVVQAPTATIGDSEWPAFWRGGPIAPGFQHETCLLEFTRRAEAFITHQVRTQPDKPFFLYFPTPSPHTPHVPRAPFRGKSLAGNYGDFVVEHDWSIGQILSTLDRHGLTDNTLVIITSDNGAHTSPVNLDRQYGHRSNSIYRGQKSDVWDGGHRIPFIARWPGVIPSRSVCDRTICLTDLLATVASICNVPLPPGAGEDSFDMLPLLQGRSDAPQRPAVVHHSFDGYFAIRQGPWKLVDCRGSGGWTLPEHRTDPKAPAIQLYNMVQDPSETTNLQDRHPDVVERLLGVLNDLRSGSV